MRHASCFLVALLATTAFVRPVSAQSVTPILPQGGSVKVGTASITTDAAGKQLSVVTQTSRTDITWRSFSIGADNTVTITQPGPSSLTINENADPDVRVDMESFFNRVAPENFGWVHADEGPDDMPAHVKATLAGSSVTVPVTAGRLALGTWQGVWLCEHRDRATPRSLVITVQGEFD